MLFSNYLTLLRGGGDLATGVAYRLHQAGFPLIVTELAQPLVVRRRVALATAVASGAVQVEALHGRRVESVAAAVRLARTGTIPVLVAPTLAPFQAYFNNTRHQEGYPAAPYSSLAVIVDARIAKRNIDTHIDQAPLVIGMGPGFTAGADCHAVVETMRGHTLGRVYWEGRALPNTGTPGIVAGKGKERVLRAPGAGVVAWLVEIGDRVAAGQRMGEVDGAGIDAPFAGVVRGLIAPGTRVQAGLKIGDVDARGQRETCFTISDKALALGGAVLAAILTSLNKREG